MLESQNLTPGGRVAGHDEIAAILGSEILSGERQPGSKIGEEQLERFGASRVLLREVTKTLVAKGMVAAKSRVGTIVLRPEYWNWFDHDVLSWRVRLGLDRGFFRHLTQMRSAVEPATAALAATERTDDDLKAMREAVAAMHGASDDRQAFARADLAFHIAVAAASGNPLFRAFTGVVETALGAYFTLSTPRESGAMRAIAERHAAIADAIEAGDGEAAARAMHVVIEEAVDHLSSGQR